MTMGMTDFMEAISAFTSEAVRDMMLPTRVQASSETQKFRPAEVFMMRLPNVHDWTKKAPFILHQIVTTADAQPSGGRTSSTVVLRSIFEVYSDNGEEGSMLLLNLMERFRIAVLRERVVSKRYELDLQSSPMEMTIYSDESTEPYYIGEIASTWKVPAVEREVREYL